MLTGQVKWFPKDNNLLPSTINLSTRDKVYENLTSKPMTNWRNRTDLCKLFPELAEGIKNFNDGDKLLDIWCGQGNALKELAYHFPHAQLTWVDKNKVMWPPYFLHVDYLEGDIENEEIWDHIPNNNKFARSCFVSMYLKNPFQLLVHLQKKLSHDGEAIVHLGYLEQYIWGEAMIRKQLSCLSSDAVRIWVPLLVPSYPTPTDQPDIHISNLQAALHPISVKITAKDELTALLDLHLTAKKGMYIEHEEVKYMLPYSNIRYIYSM
jgi:SAM-dependent methyltransferase